MDSLVTEEEVATLLVSHLQSCGYGRTAQVFRRELKEQHGLSFRGIPPGIKSLQEILADYVQLKERESFRARFLASNSLARSLQGTLDRHAGLGPAHAAGPPPASVGPAPRPGTVRDTDAAPPEPREEQVGGARAVRRRRGAAPPRKRQRPAAEVAGRALAELGVGPESLSLSDLLRDEGLQARLGAHLAEHINAAPAEPCSPPLFPHPGAECPAPHGLLAASGGQYPAGSPRDPDSANPLHTLRLPDPIATNDFWGSEVSKMGLPTGDGNTLFASLFSAVSRDGLGTAQRWGGPWQPTALPGGTLGRLAPSSEPQGAAAEEGVALAAWPCITPRLRGGGAFSLAPSLLRPRSGHTSGQPSRPEPLPQQGPAWPPVSLPGLDALVEDCIGY
ncbi:hypothetical protein ACKKBG_A10010 [Auxenochlorella protothecoides x Auxenochlorella symbiontica]